MGEHTPNLNLYKPKATQPVEKGWGALVNESIDVIDTELNAAAKSVFLVGDVVNYVSNAVYTGGKWNRRNTGLGATRVAFDPSARTITVYYVNAGANPISWVKMETFTTAGFDMGGKKVANMATPSVASDAATKGYIDGLIAALKLSQIAIDGDKDWKGKSITNLNALQAGTVNGIVPVPPPSSHLITVEPVTIDPVTIASYPGPYTHLGGHRFEETRLSFVIPSNLSDHGIPASHKLVRISVSYRMVTGTTNSYSRVKINGVDCSPLRQELTWYGSYDKTITQSIYVVAGSTLSFTTCNTLNDSSEPTISNIVVKLEGGYPFGSFTPAGYSTIAGVPNLPIAPYNFNNHSNIECTCDFGGISATMGDKKARPYFPQQPNAITLAWKPDKTWTSTQPFLQFYRGRT